MADGGEIALASLAWPSTPRRSGALPGFPGALLGFREFRCPEGGRRGLLQTDYGVRPTVPLEIRRITPRAEHLHLGCTWDGSGARRCGATPRIGVGRDARWLIAHAAGSL